METQHATATTSATTTVLVGPNSDIGCSSTSTDNPAGEGGGVAPTGTGTGLTTTTTATTSAMPPYSTLCKTASSCSASSSSSSSSSSSFASAPFAGPPTKFDVLTNSTTRSTTAPPRISLPPLEDILSMAGGGIKPNMEHQQEDVHDGVDGIDDDPSPADGPGPGTGMSRGERAQALVRQVIQTASEGTESNGTDYVPLLLEMLQEYADNDNDNDNGAQKQRQHQHQPQRQQELPTRMGGAFVHRNSNEIQPESDVSMSSHDQRGDKVSLMTIDEMIKNRKGGNGNGAGNKMATRPSVTSLGLPSLASMDSAELWEGGASSVDDDNHRDNHDNDDRNKDGRRQQNSQTRTSLKQNGPVTNDDVPVPSDASKTSPSADMNAGVARNTAKNKNKNDTGRKAAVQKRKPRRRCSSPKQAYSQLEDQASESNLSSLLEPPTGNINTINTINGTSNLTNGGETKGAGFGGVKRSNSLVSNCSQDSSIVSSIEPASWKALAGALDDHARLRPAAQFLPSALSSFMSSMVEDALDDTITPPGGTSEIAKSAAFREFMEHDKNGMKRSTIQTHIVAKDKMPGRSSATSTPEVTSRKTPTTRCPSPRHTGSNNNSISNIVPVDVAEENGRQPREEVTPPNDEGTMVETAATSSSQLQRSDSFKKGKRATATAWSKLVRRSSLNSTTTTATMVTAGSALSGADGDASTNAMERQRTKKKVAASPSSQAGGDVHNNSRKQGGRRSAGRNSKSPKRTDSREGRRGRPGHRSNSGSNGNNANQKRSNSRRRMMRKETSNSNLIRRVQSMDERQMTTAAATRTTSSSRQNTRSSSKQRGNRSSHRNGRMSSRNANRCRSSSSGRQAGKSRRASTSPMANSRMPADKIIGTNGKSQNSSFAGLQKQRQPSAAGGRRMAFRKVQSMRELQGTSDNTSLFSPSSTSNEIGQGAARRRKSNSNSDGKIGLERSLSDLYLASVKEDASNSTNTTVSSRERQELRRVKSMKTLPVSMAEDMSMKSPTKDFASVNNSSTLDSSISHDRFVNIVSLLSNNKDENNGASNVMDRSSSASLDLYALIVGDDDGHGEVSERKSHTDNGSTESLPVEVVVDVDVNAAAGAAAGEAQESNRTGNNSSTSTKNDNLKHNPSRFQSNRDQSLNRTWHSPTCPSAMDDDKTKTRTSGHAKKSKITPREIELLNQSWPSPSSTSQRLRSLAKSSGDLTKEAMYRSSKKKAYPPGQSLNKTWHCPTRDEDDGGGGFYSSNSKKHPLKSVKKNVRSRPTAKANRRAQQSLNQTWHSPRERQYRQNAEEEDMDGSVDIKELLDYLREENKQKRQLRPPSATTSSARNSQFSAVSSRRLKTSSTSLDVHDLEAAAQYDSSTVLSSSDVTEYESFGSNAASSSALLSTPTSSKRKHARKLDDPKDHRLQQQQKSQQQQHTSKNNNKKQSSRSKHPDHRGGRGGHQHQRLSASNSGPSRSSLGGSGNIDKNDDGNNNSSTNNIRSKKLSSSGRKVWHESLQMSSTKPPPASPSLSSSTSKVVHSSQHHPHHRQNSKSSHPKANNSSGGGGDGRRTNAQKKSKRKSMSSSATSIPSIGSNGKQQQEQQQQDERQSRGSTGRNNSNFSSTSNMAKSQSLVNLPGKGAVPYSNSSSKLKRDKSQPTLGSSKGGSRQRSSNGNSSKQNHKWLQSPSSLAKNSAPKKFSQGPGKKLSTKAKQAMKSLLLNSSSSTGGTSPLTLSSPNPSPVPSSPAAVEGGIPAALISKSPNAKSLTSSPSSSLAAHNHQSYMGGSYHNGQEFTVFSHDPGDEKTPPSTGRSKPLWGTLRTPKDLVRATGRILGGGVNGGFKGKTDTKSLLDNDHAQEAHLADMHASFQQMMAPNL